MHFIQVSDCQCFYEKKISVICSHETLVFVSPVNIFLRFMIILQTLLYYSLINDVRDVEDWGQELCLPLPCQTNSVGQQQILVSRLSTLAFQEYNFHYSKLFSRFQSSFFCISFNLHLLHQQYLKATITGVSTIYTLLKGALKAKALSHFNTRYKLFNNSVCTFSTDINY